MIEYHLIKKKVNLFLDIRFLNKMVNMISFLLNSFLKNQDVDFQDF